MTDIQNLTGKELSDLEKDLHDYDGEDKIITSRELEEIAQARKEDKERLETGFPVLDKTLDGGVETGELVTVAAPTGHGKTTLSMSISRNLIDNGHEISWFSYEVTPLQFVDKMKAPERYDEIPLFFVPKKHKDGDFEWLYKRILEAKSKHNIKAAFVDNLHDVVDVESLRHGDTSLEIGQIVSKLKQTALQLGIVIFLSVHLRKMKNRNTKPTIGDLRDTGRTADTSDIVLGTYRTSADAELDNRRWKKPEQGDNTSIFEIWKSRRGDFSKCFLMWKNHHYRQLITWQNEQETVTPNELAGDTWEA